MKRRVTKLKCAIKDTFRVKIFPNRNDTKIITSRLLLCHLICLSLLLVLHYSQVLALNRQHWFPCKTAKSWRKWAKPGCESQQPECESFPPDKWGNQIVARSWHGKPQIFTPEPALQSRPGSYFLSSLLPERGFPQDRSTVTAGQLVASLPVGINDFCHHTKKRNRNIIL